MAGLGFQQEIERSEQAKWYPPDRIIHNYRVYYSLAKSFGSKKLIEEVTEAIVDDPTHALDLLVAVGCLYYPAVDPLKLTVNYRLEFLAGMRRTLGRHHLRTPDDSVYEIGRFVLNKVIHYPTTFESCCRMIQDYEDHQLLRVTEALPSGVKGRRIDVVEKNSHELSTILDSIWRDARNISHKRGFISYGVSALIGLIGGLASALPGVGILAALGFQALDRYTEPRTSERLAKMVSPNYLVTVYDFQKKLPSRGSHSDTQENSVCL
ncbi:MAG: hypothetical protein WED04_09665 [Promethearchaeati archaeon SRVP18_Atabeyarchaeia-1]